MIHFDLPKQKSSIIKVIGVGGGGSNAVNYMFNQDVEGVDFIVCNTDAKAIEQSKVPNKIQLGPYLTQGLGAGANPEVGKKATEESLEEIKKILEVNTKMAFITVGMGGGTGTGGAPIIAQICKDLGILTVGIVTTPFAFEGPRRQAQAEHGIQALKPYVDTLLVISNDKLRMQYGNLKMKEAFGKADNVLATAAKCITDIINSRGHIIVDFADVCTVMKNGGVAILGKAEVEGENRAQRAIEEALASPLLNDNDIKGAKWILININSAEGDDECTMDELETINSYLRMQAGEDTDVIVGMGYDSSLDKKIGITLVATGFDAKNPFAKPVEQKVEAPKPDKIMLVLGEQNVVKEPVKAAPVVATTQDLFAPSLREVEPAAPSVYSTQQQVEPVATIVKAVEKNQDIIHFDLITNDAPVAAQPAPIEEQKVTVNDNVQFIFNEKPAQGALLNKPSNIYAESKQQQAASSNVQEEPKPIFTPKEPASPVFEFVLTEKNEVPEEPKADHFEVYDKRIIDENIPSVQQPVGNVNDYAELDEADEQRKKAVERIQKLRNLSFNMNSGDLHSDFDNVPAYIRQKMDLFGGGALTTAENFYSKYAVSKDENNNTNLSTINTFLDGKKPD